MRPPRSALLNSCVRCSGRARPARAPTAWANRATSPMSALPSSGTTMWKPFDRGLHPARQARARRADRAAASAAARSTSGIVLGRIEIEDADVRVVEVRRARRPDVRRDAVLVGDPEQRARVGDERIVHRAVLLRHLDALEPRGEALRHVLLDEALLADAGRKALHRDRPAADVRQHHRRDRLVVGGELALA